MIYFIGGSPRSGKSILSRKLSKKLNIPYISTDNIRPIVVPYFKKNSSEYFPFMKMFDGKNVDKFFEDNNGKQMFKADTKESKTIWPGVKSLIDYLLECKMDYIIEGVHLLPALVKTYITNPNIKIIFLTKTDERKIQKGLLSNKNNNDWIVDNLKKEENIKKAAKTLCEYGKYFEKEAEKHGFETINTEND